MSVMVAERRAFVPLELETDPTERRIRERRALTLVRRQRVERLGLEPCARCGGAPLTEPETGWPTPEVLGDPSLGCVCTAADRAPVSLRVLAHVHEPEESLADRICP